MRKSIFIIDAQEDFTRGALRNEEAIRALPVIQDIVKYARQDKKNYIFYTQDTHKEDYLDTQEGKNLPVPHCIEGTNGWALCPEVLYEPSDDEHELWVMEKDTFGYPYWGGYGDFIRESGEIWICGFCTDICVSANFQLLKSKFSEIPIVVIEDACAGVTPELHEAALNVMKSCQAKVMKWDELRNSL